MANGLDENGEVLFRDSQDICWSLINLFGCADTEQLCLGWGLKDYNGGGEICWFCLADRTEDCSYTNLQDDAEWRDTCPLANDVPVNC